MIFLQINFTTLGSAAVGITSVFGLMGFIYFVILRMSNQHLKVTFSQPIIEAIKRSNLDFSKLQELDIEKLKLVLENEANLSRLLVVDGVNKELTTKARYTLIISAALILSSIFLAYSNNTPSLAYTYSGIIVDSESSRAVPGARVTIIDRPDILPSVSDANGFFSLKLFQPEFSFRVNHSDFKDYMLHVNMTGRMRSDTLKLELQAVIIEKTIEGYVVDQYGNKIPGATISSPFGQLTTESDDLGFFKLKIIYGRFENPIIRCEKNGHEPFSGYIDINGQTPILLKVSS